MKREDIAKMAADAGFITLSIFDEFIDKFEVFANKAASAEREECAKVCEVGTGEPVQARTLEILRKERERIAAAIRARGNA